jgi:hypothetical protein
VEVGRGGVLPEPRPDKTLQVTFILTNNIQLEELCNNIQYQQLAFNIGV